MAQKLFVVDAMAMAFRTHHAFGHRPLTTSSGQVVSSIFGSANFLIKLIEDEQPDYLAIATDTSTPTFRHEMYDAYKANRSEMPEDLAAQIPLLYDLFKYLKIPLLVQPGFEADDIIGSLVHQFSSKDVHCYMVSGDKDFLQLINSEVFLYSPKKGGVVKIVDEAGVSEKFPECGPKHVIDVLALMGDSSDNVPGVPGIGEKGAAKLVSQHGSLDEIYSNLDAITNKRQKTGLTDNKEQAYLSRDLVTIKTDMSLGITLDDLKYTPKHWSTEDLVEFFKTMEFRGLTNRAEQNFNRQSATETISEEPAKESAGKAEGSKANYELCNTKEKLDSLWKQLEKSDLICFDTETTGLDVVQDKPIGVSLSVGEGSGFYIPLIEKHLEISEESAAAFINRVMALPSAKVAHNAKYDKQMLSNIGIHCEGTIHDTMLCSYLLDPSGKSHGLDACCERYLNYEKISITTLTGKDKKGSMLEAAIEDLTTYACEDADLTLRLFHKLFPQLKEQGLDRVYLDIESPLISVLAQMEQHGIYLNAEILADFSQELGVESDKLTKRIYELAGEEFNINSTKQLQAVLFEKLKVHEELGITRLKKTKTGFSTDSSVMEKLSAHPLANEILSYRTVTKLKNTYVDTLPQLINRKSGRLHTSFHQSGTATGRLSSSNPNLQNIPIRTDLGRRIREAFQSEKSDSTLISADYSQVELRILAHIAKEESLVEAFKAGADIHTSTAAKIFGLKPADVDSDTRSKAKAINFGIIYGMGPQRLARTTNVSMSEAKSFIEKYFEGFPKIAEYIERSKSDARQKGYTETITGRRRPLPDIHSKNRMTLVNAENIAVNSPIQGSAADLIKLAMIHIHNKIQQDKLDLKMLLQVHDELIFECPKALGKDMMDMIKSEMESAMDLNVPLEVDINSGNNWLVAH